MRGQGSMNTPSSPCSPLDRMEESNEPQSSSAVPQKGVAGRINYAAWDKVANELVSQVEEEDEQEIEEEKKKLGLHGKYARSADEATEREKAAKVKQTKRTLDKFKKRETSIIQNLTDLLHPTKVLQNETKTPEDQTLEKTVVRITRDHLDAGKRVVSITDVTGIAMDQSTVVLTSDLSLLESSMPSNATAKTFQDDAENEVDETPQQRSIFGVIKVFLANIQNCTILIKCKIITGTVELHNCRNVCIKVEHEATVATIQADLSSDIQIEFHDAVSGKHVPGSKKILYWGEDKDDRIFHAGISNMQVRIFRDGYLESELTADYLKDGAEQIGNSSPEEFQFVTSCLEGGQLVTEKVVRSGNTTGKNVRAMTDRELAAEQERRERAAKCAVKMAEDMVQIKDKDGNILVQKTEAVEVPKKEEEEEVVEEVYTSMSKAEIESIVQECEHLKARGNEAFGAGEYGQAILHYSLSLDKAEELPDAHSDDEMNRGKSLFPRDLVYSNRAAAFLKLGQHEKAEADSVKALAINPDNVKALFRKGLALHASGRYTEALPCLAAAYKKEPKNAQIQQALKFCEVRLEQEHRMRMSKD